MYSAASRSCPRTAVRCPIRPSLISLIPEVVNCNDFEKQIKAEKIGQQKDRQIPICCEVQYTAQLLRGSDHLQSYLTYLQPRTGNKITNSKLPVNNTMKPRHLYNYKMSIPSCKYLGQRLQQKKRIYYLSYRNSQSAIKMKYSRYWEIVID